MKVNKNSPRRPLRPLSAIIDFPTPAGRRWGKHFRDGKKSSECWERENNPKKLCVCLCLFGALPSLRWKRFRCNERWMMMTTRAVERDSGGLAQTHTRRNIHQYCGFWLARRLVSHVEWWRGGGSFSTVRHGKRPAATDMGSWQSRAPVVLFIIDTTTEERERGLGNKVRESLWQRPSCTADQIECSPLHSYLYDVTKN